MRASFTTARRVRAVRPEEAMIAAWGFLYRKHLPKTLATRAALAWYVTGVFLGATMAALARRTLAPLRSAWAGLRELHTDFAGSPFLSSSSAPARLAR
jgi:hypothetical protein